MITKVPSSYLRFLDSKKRCSDLLSQIQSNNPDVPFTLLKEFESLSGLLYTIRHTLGPNDPKRVQAEESMVNLAIEFANLRQVPKQKKTKRSWYENYQKAWKDHLSLFYFTALFFLALSVLGWVIVRKDPSFAPVFLSDAVVENILSGHKWFDRLQENPLLGSLQIAWNNIRVCINACLLGSLLGIGGLYVLGFNALMVGAVLGFGAVHQFDDEVLQFIVSHGPLELTMIIASSFCGLVVGRSFYTFPVGEIKRRLPIAAQDALILLSGVIPWLIFAALIEGFISPMPQFENSLKILIGTLAAALFWIFTFMPVRILSSARKGESQASSSHSA